MTTIKLLYNYYIDDQYSNHCTHVSFHRTYSMSCNCNTQMVKYIFILKIVFRENYDKFKQSEEKQTLEHIYDEPSKEKHRVDS